MKVEKTYGQMVKDLTEKHWKDDLKQGTVYEVKGTVGSGKTSLALDKAFNYMLKNNRAELYLINTFLTHDVIIEKLYGRISVLSRTHLDYESNQSFKNKDDVYGLLNKLPLSVPVVVIVDNLSKKEYSYFKDVYKKYPNISIIYAEQIPKNLGIKLKVTENK